jgi:hypothetical protein
VLFGVGYHGWINVTGDEQVILCGGGPYDGPAELMSLCRSELGGVAAGIVTVGTLYSSGLLKI